jgi:hypothetical protein
MAKVQLPLLSGSATGQFGKAIAYYRCKNIQTGRAYTIPTRPGTPAQKAQTTLYEKAVEAWHHWGHSYPDQAAFKTWGGIHGYPYSGYSTWLAVWMESYKAGNDWAYLGYFEVPFKTPTKINVNISGYLTTPTPTLYWGTSKYDIHRPVPMTLLLPQRWWAVIPGLRPYSKYYFRIEAGTKWTNFGHTGIYFLRTLPKPP